MDKKYTYQYLEIHNGDYLFKRYYVNGFDGFNSFNLKQTIGLLDRQCLIHDEETKAFLEYLKLTRL